MPRMHVRFCRCSANGVWKYCNYAALTSPYSQECNSYSILWVNSSYMGCTFVTRCTRATLSSTSTVLCWSEKPMISPPTWCTAALSGSFVTWWWNCSNICCAHPQVKKWCTPILVSIWLCTGSIRSHMYCILILVYVTVHMAAFCMYSVPRNRIGQSLHYSYLQCKMLNYLEENKLMYYLKYLLNKKFEILMSCSFPSVFAKIFHSTVTWGIRLFFLNGGSKYYCQCCYYVL